MGYVQSQPDIRQVYGFELRGKVIADAYEESTNTYIIEFTDGQRIRISGHDNEIHVQKLTIYTPSK